MSAGIADLKTAGNRSERANYPFSGLFYIELKPVEEMNCPESNPELTGRTVCLN